MQMSVLPGCWHKQRQTAANTQHTHAPLQGPHVESLTQDQRLLLPDPAGESDNVQAARETFVYLWQYLHSLESEVSCWCHLVVKSSLPL